MNDNANPAGRRSPEQWGSRTGFILATIGSAAGVGNIWRFSYVAGENGGGVFFLLYLVSVALIGLPIIIAETAVGRAFRHGTAAATRRLLDLRHWHMFRALSVLSALLILSFYAVIAGWSLRYLVGALNGSLLNLAKTGPGKFFAAFAADPTEPVIWQGLMMAGTTLIVIGGVRSGIETANRILMPALFAAVTLLAAYGLTQPGAQAGIRFLFSPDWQALGEPQVYLAAMGQAFFSLGVGMAIFVTYGGYLPERQRIPTAACAVIIGDTLVACLAGIAIFTTVFAHGTDPAAGPELAFITLPQIFVTMPAGRLFAALFFALLVAGALTSMISLLEVPVAWCLDYTRLSRRQAAPLLGGLIFVIGIPSALGFGLLSDIRWNGRGILDSIDFLATNFLLPLGGLAVLFLVGWRWERKLAIAAANLESTGWGVIWLWLIRIVTPVLTVAIIAREIAHA